MKKVREGVYYTDKIEEFEKLVKELIHSSLNADWQSAIIKAKK